MAQGKKTFIFYSDWVNMVNEMPDGEAGKLLKHILQYVNDKNPQQPESLLVRMAFAHMKPILKADLEKWDEIRGKRSLSGAKGGAVKQTQANAKQTEAKESKRKQVEAVNVNVNGNVNVNVNENENKRKPLTTLMSDAIASQGEKDEFQKISEGFYQLFKKNEIDLGVNWVSLKKSTLKNFRDPIRLMMERDGVTKQDLTDIFKFLQASTENSQFWKQQIQSTAGIRKHYDKLITKARNNEARKPTTNGSTREYDPAKVQEGLAYLRSLRE